MSINALDALVLVIIAFNMILGAMRGAVWQILRIASIVAGIWVASHYGERFHDAFKDKIDFGGSWGIIIARVALFLSVYLVMFGITQLVKLIIDKIKLGSIDRLFGAVFGALKGAAFCCILLYLQYIPPINQISLFEHQLYGRPPEYTDYSRANYHFLKHVKPWLDKRVPEDLKKRVDECCAKIPELTNAK